MMDYFSISGIVLMLGLGLRHGLDPDHIAAIDGMTYRSLDKRPGLSRWVGTLFALGHGMVVTVIALGVGFIGQRFSLPATALSYAEWLPLVLLLLIGTLNLQALLRQDHYQAIGWKTRILPKRLREATHPAAIVLVGVFFAVVFDTATQAAAWGYAATAHGGITHALLIGVVFTLGMVVTDTIDGRIMCRICTQGKTRDEIERYRRHIGWLIVMMSFSVAGYKILSHVFPQIEMTDLMYTGIGLGFMLSLPLFYLLIQRRGVTYTTRTN